MLICPHIGVMTTFALATIGTMASSAPSKTPRYRRRGEVLERALYEATLAELKSVGYGKLSMQGISARARTGKAALYRRWASKHELVLAALQFALPPVPVPRADRSARENLVALFSSNCEILAGKTPFPGIEIAGQLMHEPELREIFVNSVWAPRLLIVESILQKGARAGEIDPATLTPLTARIGLALIHQHVLFTGSPPDRDQLGRIVDAVIMPRAQPVSANDAAVNS